MSTEEIKINQEEIDESNESNLNQDKHDPTPLLDPRLNCAAHICCPPPKALKAQKSILYDMLTSDSAKERINSLVLDGDFYFNLVEIISSCMNEHNLVFMPRKLTDVIAEIVDHPDRKEKVK